MHSPKIEKLEQEALEMVESAVVKKYGLGEGNRKQRRAAKAKIVKDIRKLGKMPKTYRETIHLLAGNK